MTDWPHAPLHRLDAEGAYIVTASTYQKRRFFDSPKRLQIVHDTLLQLAGEFGWQLQAWAVLANHYHFVAQAQEDSSSLKRMIQAIHSLTARGVNAEDQARGRKV